VDYDDLESELDALAERVGEQDSKDAENPADTTTASGAGAGSLNGLSVMPDPRDGMKTDLPLGEWDAICEGAERVADTLEKTLRLDRQSESRTGQTSGSLNTSEAYRLPMGDTRAFGREIPGEEKAYALVIVLDRSGSMQRGHPPKIDIATRAVARFALAAEDLGIDVSIIDFIDNEARLLKPFSVNTAILKGTIVAEDNGGKTPLADAIKLAVDLVEQQADEPLIVSMTDDRPGDVEAVERVVREAWVPICSLTIATDCERGNAPETAQRLQRVWERTETVFDEEQLDRTLDRLASLMTGL
jgi:hypothetical protein